MAAVAAAEAQLGPDVRRLHYLSVPPKAALAVITRLRDAQLVERARVVMETPFGTDLDSAIRLNDQVHETFDESQIFRIDHFLGKEAAQNILAFRFASAWPKGRASSRSRSRRRRGRCSPANSGVGSAGPDHLTFDLADSLRVSLSFYGKRPGPGMKLDKLSMQFSTQETDHAGEVLEAYERLILDAMHGDHTLFTTADGIESLWERSIPLLEDPPPVKPYSPGTWGPNAIHQLIAPHAWRLRFERTWREKK